MLYFGYSFNIQFCSAQIYLNQNDFLDVVAFTLSKLMKSKSLMHIIF